MVKKLTQFSALGKLVNGKIEFNNRRYFDGNLSLFADCDVRVIVERLRGSKSRAQLGYLFGHLYEVMSTATGYTVNEVDRAMKAKFLKGNILWRGVNYQIANDKRDLLHDEMEEFIGNVYMEALELGLNVKEPDKEHRTHRDFPESVK